MNFRHVQWFAITLDHYNETRNLGWMYSIIILAEIVFILIVIIAEMAVILRGSVTSNEGDAYGL